MSAKSKLCRVLIPSLPVSGSGESLLGPKDSFCCAREGSADISAVRLDLRRSAPRAYDNSPKCPGVPQPQSHSRVFAPTRAGWHPQSHGSERSLLGRLQDFDRLQPFSRLLNDPAAIESGRGITAHRDRGIVECTTRGSPRLSGAAAPCTHRLSSARRARYRGRYRQ